MTALFIDWIKSLQFIHPCTGIGPGPSRLFCNCMQSGMEAAVDRHNQVWTEGTKKLSRPHMDMMDNQDSWWDSRTGDTQEDSFCISLTEDRSEDRSRRISRKVLLEGIDLGEIANKIINEEMILIRIEICSKFTSSRKWKGRRLIIRRRKNQVTLCMCNFVLRIKFSLVCSSFLN